MSFWKGKRVFLTGHTGFKGGWLAMWLEHLGATVHGYALEPNTKPSLFHALQLSDSTSSTMGDIRDLQKLKSAFETARPDFVFHLAAQPLVRRSYADPLETYSTNVMGTANVLDVVRTSGRPCVVVVATTDKVYENREWCWPYRETETLGGYDPYSSSKAAAEIVVAAYRRSFFHPDKKSQHRVSLASARAGNVIGGGDWSDDRLVPDMVRAFQAGEPVRLRNPNSTRPWQHVLEPLSAYLSLARQMSEAGPRSVAAFDTYNFGPLESDCWPVGRIVETFSQAWGPQAKVEIDQGEHVHEAGFLQLDSSKAKVQLGWRPHWNVTAALAKTAEWYRAVGEKPGAAREMTLRQIREWESSEQC